MNSIQLFTTNIFIGVFVSMGHGRGPYTKVDFITQYNRTMYLNLDKNITCKDGCKRRSNSTRRVIIDPITIVPVLQDVPQKKTQKKIQPQVQKKVQSQAQKKVQSQAQKKVQPQVEKPQAEKPTTYLRNGYYSQPILKTHLRGSPLVKNLAAYNPPDRYCYSIVSSIKSIVGI